MERRPIRLSLALLCAGSTCMTKPAIRTLPQFYPSTHRHRRCHCRKRPPPRCRLCPSGHCWVRWGSYHKHPQRNLCLNSAGLYWGRDGSCPMTRAQEREKGEFRHGEHRLSFPDCNAGFSAPFPDVPFVEGCSQT